MDSEINGPAKIRLTQDCRGIREGNVFVHGAAV